MDLFWDPASGIRLLLEGMLSSFLDFAGDEESPSDTVAFKGRLAALFEFVETPVDSVGVSDGAISPALRSLLSSAWGDA